MWIEKQDAERLDKELQVIQNELWNIESKKQRIRQSIKHLDREWHELDSRCQKFQEEYTRIQELLASTPLVLERF